MSSNQRFGFLVGLCAYFIWGSLPLYIRAMRHVLPQELLAHRVIWSVPTALLLIALAGNWRDIRAAFHWRTAKWLILFRQGARLKPSQAAFLRSRETTRVVIS